MTMGRVMTLEQYGKSSFGKMGARSMLKAWTSHDYVQDGLLAMWDGIENADYGLHLYSTTVWKDLSGNGHDCIANHGTTLDFSDNAFVADGTKSLVAMLPNEVGNFDGGTSLFAADGTVEVVFHMPHRSGRIVYETLMCLSSGGFRIAAPTDSAEVVSRGLSLKGGSRASAFSGLHVLQPAGYSLLFGFLGVDSTYLNGEYLGTFAPSVGFQNTTPGLIPLSYLDATFLGSIYSVRVYSRHLTVAEIQDNHEIDRKRFNLQA